MPVDDIVPNRAAMKPILSGASKGIANALIQKIQDAKDGKNISGAETMCRCVETLIKLARLEMDYQRMRQQKPMVDFLTDGEDLDEPQVESSLPEPEALYKQLRGEVEKDLAAKRPRDDD